MLTVSSVGMVQSRNSRALTFQKFYDGRRCGAAASLAQILALLYWMRSAGILQVFKVRESRMRCSWLRFSMLCCSVCCSACYSVLLWVVRRVAACCSVMQCDAVGGAVGGAVCVSACCSVMQRMLQWVVWCVAACCSVMQGVAVSRGYRKSDVVCRRVLQCVAVCCSVLQCVAVRCSELQCVLQCEVGCCSISRISKVRKRRMRCLCLRCIRVCCSVCCSVV